MTTAPRRSGAPEEEAEVVAEEEAEVVTDAEVASEEAPGAAPESARVADDLDALDEIARERDEYLELAKRARADFENFRKRATRDAAEAERRGKAALARELLPAIDNLERALQASGIDLDRLAGADRDDPPSQEVSGQEAFARGVQLVLGELQAALARAGVEIYDPAGERFDPNLHEALSTR